MPVLVIQMGHTGRPPNPGSVGTAGEQDFSGAVGQACVRELHGRGGWVVRTIIADPPLASAYRGDAFVAIHADGSTDPGVRGGSVGYQTPEGGEFAHAWQAAYTAAGFTGGWQRDNYTDNLHYYYGVREAVRQGNRRAFIAECGHLTNPADRALMTGPGGPERVARALGRALGIPLDKPEDDMSWADDLKILPGTPGYTAGETLKASVMLADTLAVAHRVEVQNAGLLAAVNHLAEANAAGDTAHADELRAVVREEMARVVQVQVSVVDGDQPAATG